MGLPNHMQQAGTRLSGPAPKWYREAFRDANGNPQGNPKANVKEHLKGTPI
jgi:hypothetical protein